MELFDHYLQLLAPDSHLSLVQVNQVLLGHLRHFVVVDLVEVSLRPAVQLAQLVAQNFVLFGQIAGDLLPLNSFVVDELVLLLNKVLKN